MRPMLATPAPADGTPPPGPQWSHEVKWDGMRVLADIHDGAVRLRSRSEADVTVAFPELVAAVPEMADAHLDGEVVALRDGVPSFAALAERIHVRQAGRAAALAERQPVTFMAFDVVRLYGVDLTARPLEERRATLERLDLPALGGDGRWQVPPAYDDGPALMQATLDQGLEGVMSKRLSSRYQPGRRSADWVKLPHRATRTLVVGGWRPETSTSSRIGAVLLGEPVGATGLLYRGRVGSGLSSGMAADLRRLLAPAHQESSPFDDDLPRDDADGTVWCDPRVCVDVRYLGHGAGGRLRQPVLRGIRGDLTIADLRADESR